MRLEVRLRPEAVRDEEIRGRVVVVIDVIRFSTSVTVALESGARRVLPAASVEEARRLARTLGRSEVLLCGEQGGDRVEGYDLGNSPREFKHERVAGRTLVYSTTNGTRAVDRVRDAGRVLVACMRNLGAVAGRVRAQDQPTLLLCAGRAGSVALDDAWCAGLLAERIGREGRIEPDDTARLALAAARSLGLPDRSALERTESGAAVAARGLAEDLEVCAQMDRTGTVPVLEEGSLVLEDRDP